MHIYCALKKLILRQLNTTTSIKKYIFLQEGVTIQQAGYYPLKLLALLLLELARLELDESLMKLLELLLL